MGEFAKAGKRALVIRSLVCSTSNTAVALPWSVAAFGWGAVNGPISSREDIIADIFTSRYLVKAEPSGY
jgi:hypothetical protein